jgi:hypothetical protein
MAEKKKGDFVLSTTVTETVLLLFFLLLLLLVFTVDRSTREIRDATARADKERLSCSGVRDELTALERRLAPLLESDVPQEKRERMKRALIALNSVETVLAEKRESSESLTREVEGLREVAVKVRDGLRKEGLKDEEIASAAKKASCDAAESQAKQLQASNVALASKTELQDRQLGDANQRNRELQERYKSIMQKGGKGGDEYVACWKNGDDIEYIFRVYLERGRVRVERAWPDRRESDMAKYESERGLVGQTVDLASFLDATKTMFADSKAQSCRHFVEIIGKRSEMDRVNFTNYQGVQNHFYKKDSVR